MGFANRLFLWAEFFLQQFSANDLLTIIIIIIIINKRLISASDLTLNVVSFSDQELLINFFHKISQLLENYYFQQNGNFSDIYIILLE